MKNPPLGFVIGRTAQRLKSRVTAALKPFDITPEQFAILKELWESDGVKQTDIAGQTCKDAPNTARILERLEKKGLVRRERHPGDRRCFEIRLTPEGRRLQALVEPVMQRVRGRAFRTVSAEEQAVLLRLLSRILNDI